MSYPLLASLAPDVALEPNEPTAAIPRRLELRMRGAPMACPSVWSDVAAPGCGLAPRRSVLVWRRAGLVVLAGSAQVCGLGKRGIRGLPFTTEAVEDLLAFVEPGASAADVALGVGGLLGLAVVLTEDEAREVVHGDGVRRRAPLGFLERWRAPYRDEDTVIFHAGPDPIVEVRVELKERWIDLEEVCAGWTPPPLTLAIAGELA
jgi:hypothetical protein